jgi:hypothetical protein
MFIGELFVQVAGAKATFKGQRDQDDNNGEDLGQCLHQVYMHDKNHKLRTNKQSVKSFGLLSMSNEGGGEAGHTHRASSLPRHRH